MTRSFALLAASLLGACAPSAPTPTPPAPARPAQAPTPPPPGVARYLQDGQRHVIDFFQEPYPAPFDTRVFSDRKSLDAFAGERWQMPPTQCWMVAMGAGPIIVVLDPAVWKAQACEHDGTDERHVGQVITHELVHVFHGQHCPRPEFDGMDDAGWFVEGLAIYAAGQLDDTRRAQAREAAAAGLPPSLAQAWSGNARYAVAGSLVNYIDEVHGRQTLKSMMTAVSNEQLLAKLGTTEDRLLTDWRARVLKK